MTYSVTIKSSDGASHRYKCGGSTDQEAMIYAGKIVEEKADPYDPNASVTIDHDGNVIGPAASVGEMVARQPEKD